MNHTLLIIHCFIHLTAGAAITLLFVHPYCKTFASKMTTTIIGAFIGECVDIPKIFGSIVFHSLLVAPIFGLLMAMLLKSTLPQMSWLRAWITTTTTILFGHLLIDYLGNGNEMLYPLHTEDYLYALLSRRTEILITFVLFILISLYWLSGRRIVLGTGLFSISLLVISLLISKQIATHKLMQQYATDKPVSIIISPSRSGKLFHWGYHVKMQDDDDISGEVTYSW